MRYGRGRQALPCFNSAASKELIWFVISKQPLGSEQPFFCGHLIPIAASSLNSAAGRAGEWITAITRDRFHVPAWVGHEAYGKIRSRFTALRPMEKAAAEFNTAALLPTAASASSTMQARGN